MIDGPNLLKGSTPIVGQLPDVSEHTLISAKVTEIIIGIGGNVYPGWALGEYNGKPAYFTLGVENRAQLWNETRSENTLSRFTQRQFVGRRGTFDWEGEGFVSVFVKGAR